jgi:hypothetical protein
MDDALFLPCGVLSIGNGFWFAGVSLCLYTEMPGWAGHGFGVVSVSESVSVINVLDGGSKTIVGFVNGSSGCGLQSKGWVAWEKKRTKTANYQYIWSRWSVDETTKLVGLIYIR